VLAFELSSGPSRRSLEGAGGSLRAPGWSGRHSNSASLHHSPGWNRLGRPFSEQVG
jgi:hypothetical protein